MPLDQRLHGKTGRMQADYAGGSSLVTLGDIEGWDLSMSTDRVDVTCLEDTNKRRVSGLPDYSGGIKGVWNALTSSSPAYFAAVLAGLPVTLRLIPNKLDPTVYFQGLANIDGGISVDASGAVTTTGKWDAAGNWTMAP